MSRNHFITYPKRTVATRQRVNKLQGGDEVEIYDGELGDYDWFIVMDSVQRDGRMRIRIEGCNYYFDSGLVRDVRLNHYVAPHRALLVTSLIKSQGAYFRVDKYYGLESHMRRVIVD